MLFLSEPTIQGPQTLQMPNMCVPAYIQRLHADAHLATLKTISWVSDVWKGFPKCSFPLQAWAKIHSVNIVESEHE